MAATNGPRGSSASNPVSMSVSQSGAYGSGTVTIASSGTTSGAISMVSGGRLAGLIIPASFTGTSISFSVSADGSTYGTFKQFGTAVSITVVASDAVDILGAYVGLCAWPYVKVVSNATEAASRTIGYVTA